MHAGVLLTQPDANKSQHFACH